MNNLIEIDSSNMLTMSSIELRDIINNYRVKFNEPKVRNDQFIARIENELEGELRDCKNFAHPQSGVSMKAYNLTLDQCMLVGMRESKGVRRKVLDKLRAIEHEQDKLPTTYLAALEKMRAKIIAALDKMRAKIIEATNFLGTALLIRRLK